MFIDASALCAILLDEADRDAFADRIDAATRRLTSPVAIYETAMALARDRRNSAGDAGRDVQTFLAMANVDVIMLDEQIGLAALERDDAAVNR